MWIISTTSITRNGGRPLNSSSSDHNVASFIAPILNEAQQRLEASSEASHVAGAIIDLASQLRKIKRESEPVLWDAVVEFSRLHPLREIVHEDPLSWRAFNKPRGYQGDAQLLDVIYNKDYSEVWQHAVTPLGKSIFSYTIECNAPESVRDRRSILSTTIDEMSEQKPKPHILSVACGHLREAHASEAVRNKRCGRYVGLDQDADSISLVNKELSAYGVETVQGSIKLFLGGSFTKQRFDFIYAAGLYDYLEDRLACRLTERMFSMLNRGGRLLVANYLPDIEDVGYMEIYMGWRLIYRSVAQAELLSQGIPTSEVECQRTFVNKNNNVVYLDLKRGT
jgi:hypothetical protein